MTEESFDRLFERLFWFAMIGLLPLMIIAPLTTRLSDGAVWSQILIGAWGAFFVGPFLIAGCFIVIATAIAMIIRPSND